jgi:predicted  nucleic acid-binding Zn-ribbon protein
MKREEQEEHNEKRRVYHLQLAVDKLHSSIAALQKKTPISCWGIDSAVAIFKREHESVVVEIASLRKEIASLKREIASLTKEHLREIANLKKVHKTAVEDIASLKKGHDSALKKIDNLKEKYESAVKEIQEKHQSTVREINELRAITTSNQKFHINRVIKYRGFAVEKRDNTRWFSPGFYTSPGGYKMCLCVYANGNGMEKGTHVSCYIWLKSGEYDDILDWPFHGEVTIELLNQLENKNHHKDVVYFNEETSQACKSRVIRGERAEDGWGRPQFISQSQLDFKHPLNRQYLKDDTLYFRVNVKVTSNTKPWLVT